MRYFINARYTNFYPRSPCGERQDTPLISMPKPGFLSTLSLRRATISCAWSASKLGISIHALLAESDSAFDVLAVSAVLISIHALLAESDTTRAHIASIALHFYPRSPCGERRQRGSWPVALLFQLHFYPRSPCGERPESLTTYFDTSYFYPRSPCGERHLGAWKSCNVCDFYPRSPCGERPYRQGEERANQSISIHALLAESDSKSAQNSGALLRI